MKKNVLKNITLDRGEKVYKDFRKLNALKFVLEFNAFLQKV